MWYEKGIPKVVDTGNCQGEARQVEDRSMRWSVRLLAVALGLLPLVGLAEPPPLRIEAPARFAPLASRLQNLNPHAVSAAMELVGLREPGPPISIILAPEDSETARRAPSWVSGYALVPVGSIVLFPERQVSYPHGSLEGLLLHELTHVFAMRMTRGHKGPRWFEEGLAMVASGERDLEDRAWGFWIGLTTTPTSSEEINRLFGENPPAVQKAYLLAEALVRYLMTSLGPDIPRRILGKRAEGVPFEDAVQTVTGRSLLELEREFWAQQTAWRRWIPLVTSSAILWVIIVLLALGALRRQRQRAAAVKRRWEKEEEEL
jgi:peptidase MA superfamily protein